MRTGERQVAPDIQGIRRDHVARYEWARSQIRAGGRVLDVACGVGYGSLLLAESGYETVGVDNDVEAIEFARRHYSHSRASFFHGDANALTLEGEFDAAVCFETVEHLRDPLPLLKALRCRTRRLIASVPNEYVFPFRNYAFHYRHYRPDEFESLLNSAGWRVVGWYGQQGPHSEVENNCMGRTMIAVAEAEDESPPAPTPESAPVKHFAHAPAVVPAATPEHVAILGLGPSLQVYMDLVRRLGARHKLCDETWVLNALGDLFCADRVFHMDDVRIQEIRARARPDSNIANMLTWLRRHPGPIFTSRSHPDYPGLVDYPLEDVVNHLRFGYFNSTCAYAIAYAIHIGVKQISLFGVDFSYPNAHDAEKGRACVEFWLGIAAARGIKLAMPPCSALMDALETPAKRYYGYDCVDIARERDATGRLRFFFMPRPVLPTADEIEADYDHSSHPNALVSGEDRGPDTND